MTGLPSWADALIAAALDAVDPRPAVARHLRRAAAGIRVDETEYAPVGRVCVLSLGKAAASMLAGARDALDDRIDEALVVTKHAADTALAEVVIGDHPVPGRRSESAGRRVCAFVDALEPSDLLVVLLSGGASALVAAPVVGIGVQDVGRVTQALLRCGATIAELNTVRRHLDVLKGGGLAARCRAPVVTLVLSDVLGDALEAVGSGPTVPDPTTPGDAIRLLRRFGLDEPAVLAALEAASTKCAPPAQQVLIGSCASAVQAAEHRAAELGFHVVCWGAHLEGEAAEVGRRLAAELRDYDGPQPACFVGGGETTVTVRGRGKGGRNLELALGAVEPLSRSRGRALVTFATDGEDGPTDAAGAWVDEESRERGARLGLDAADHLRRNDSYAYFEALGALLRPGPTGTNANDLVLGFVGDGRLPGFGARTLI